MKIIILSKSCHLLRILNKIYSGKDAHLHALNLEFHMVFSGGFSIFSFFPAVAITTVANLFPRVEEHGTTFWSENDKEKWRLTWIGSQLKKNRKRKYVFCFFFLKKLFKILAPTIHNFYLTNSSDSVTNLEFRIYEYSLWFLFQLAN